MRLNTLLDLILQPLDNMACRKHESRGKECIAPRWGFLIREMFEHQGVALRYHISPRWGLGLM